VAFELGSHKRGWYNSTKVYHKKLLQLGKQYNHFFGLGTFSLALAILSQFWGIKNLSLVFFLWVWH
jgi:hypothetical protein